MPSTTFMHLDTPIGVLTLVADDTGLRRIDFPPPRPPPPGQDWTEGSNDVLVQTVRQLEEYFAGTRQAFDLPLSPHGTGFQREVWSTLAQIPYGATWSYRDLAQRIGRPSAMRAVGAANGRNPLPIVLPCHRVIGANGALTGFGGGLPTKAFLLRLEGSLPAGSEDLFPAAVAR
ncbi:MULTISPECIES: methylated-DNA--[protein]-cysteine S-methyltransferase [unclassified Luteimonas]|uniref:methylated-DNA--[protein]-cysteine S-methyltransferase n=1 Tax=unclassified Luteimonas TaxID=2629088 RepID=UPI0018F08289|nr:MULTISPECIES: methylated-DNA--[protein]-cysteine S-methyltransferase [unclassified Luteimonas]MBJ6979664.1 methylated-DNA--[protein]-cysteine S-methyltransferase [Luteimonas sp. MC1895]MBJ6983051.1 methylated-DNA--[protein]-cysteine S-methyltransferase [Luteimonas sp. MC1750]QQO05235.1 methylated-DNA--[protein]-cysteine S-methyltransferase [Luteimonas sp. MC1750]